MNLLSTIAITNLIFGVVLGNVEYARSPYGDSKKDAGDAVLDLADSLIPALKFCCDRHHFFDFANRTCVDSGQRLEPRFYTREGQLLNEKVNFYNISDPLSCPSYLVDEREFQLYSTGEMLLRGEHKVDTDFAESHVSSEKFCLIWINDNNSYKMSALVCFPEESDEMSLFRKVVHEYLFPITMSISALFLAATFLVYCLVGELQDLLGKSLMCSVASLCISKVFGVLAKTVSQHLYAGQCIAIGLLMHLGFLHAFFWLNVISLILFVSICFQGKRYAYSRKKWFLFGCIYAFGVPFLILGLILLHDFTSHLDNFVVPKPGFGVTSCGFKNRGAQVVYFYAPISILLGINLILFCASACRIFILAKQSTVSVFQFTHYLKLLVLMGIPWIFEVLSFFFAENYELSAVTFVWLSFDLFNALQGVVIFIVFACRRPVFARLSETLCGSSYARKKYPDVFLQHANEEMNDPFTQDLRLMDTEQRNRSDIN